MRLSPELEAKVLELAGVVPVPPAGLTEKAFQAEVVRRAKRLGWKAYHTHDSRKSEAGFPDLVLARPGLVLAPELKVGDNVATPEQDEWLRLLDGAVVWAGLWRPEMWPEIDRALTGAGARTGEV